MKNTVKVKEYWRDKPRTIHLTKTKFEVFISKVKSFIRKFVKLSLIGLFIYGVFVAGRYTNIEYTAPQVKAVVKDTLTDKVVQLKGEVLDTLMSCESRGYENEDGIIIFDSNKEPSIGQFQFQRDTVVYYYKALYGKEITRKDAIIIALDADKSRDLAEDIIFQDKGKGVNNWYNCNKKHNLKAKIDVIKELEQ